MGLENGSSLLARFTAAPFSAWLSRAAGISDGLALRTRELTDVLNAHLLSLQFAQFLHVFSLSEFRYLLHSESFRLPRQGGEIHRHIAPSDIGGDTSAAVASSLSILVATLPEIALTPACGQRRLPYTTAG